MRDYFTHSISKKTIYKTIVCCSKKAISYVQDSIVLVLGEREGGLMIMQFFKEEIKFFLTSFA